MRLDRPIGIWLLLLPALWGIWAAYFPLETEARAGRSLSDALYYSVIFFIGAVVMRSAGCVINDFFDRDFDKHVLRTAKRPLADGTIKPYYALLLFVALSIVGLGVLVQLPLLAILIGCGSFIPIILYPLMKRLTYFPQLFLGIIYNIGIIIGYVTMTKTFHGPILLLYCSGIFLTVAYDTIYAFQDIQDDLKIGVKSTAIMIQKHKPQLWIMLCYAFSLVCFGLFLNNLWGSVFLCLLMIAIAIKIWQWNPHNTNDALHLFKMNVWLLVVLLGVIICFL